MVVHRLAHYSRFIKVEHTLFSIPLLFSGAVLAAGGWPSGRLLAWILVAGTGARTAAFAANRMIDRHIDRLNPRTATRELPAGIMSLVEACGVGAAGIAFYLIAAWKIAPICLYLSPIPLAIFVVYPYLKRFTALAHFGIGLAVAMAPLGGWMAVVKGWRPLASGLWLGLFTFFWVSGFDIIYATLDETFDRERGLYSLPACYGKRKALAASSLLHAAAFGSLIILYIGWLRSGAALVTLFAVGALLYLEHLQAQDVDTSFFKINAILGFGVLGIIVLGVGRPL